MKQNHFFKSIRECAGFSLIELLIVLAIMAILTTITISTFVSSRKTEALSKDTEAVIEILEQARNQTISSKNASAYGVNFSTSSLTLFAGTSYSSSDPNNQTTALSFGTTLTTTLPSGTTAIVFNRITGETNQSSTVTIKLLSSTLASTTVKIYKTGTIEKSKQ